MAYPQRFWLALKHLGTRFFERRRAVVQGRIESRLRGRKGEALSELSVMGPEIFGVWQLEHAAAVSGKDWKTARHFEDKLIFGSEMAQ